MLSFQLWFRMFVIIIVIVVTHSITTTATTTTSTSTVTASRSTSTTKLHLRNFLHPRYDHTKKWQYNFIINNAPYNNNKTFSIIKDSIHSHLFSSTSLHYHIKRRQQQQHEHQHQQQQQQQKQRINLSCEKEDIDSPFVLIDEINNDINEKFRKVDHWDTTNNENERRHNLLLVPRGGASPKKRQQESNDVKTTKKSKTITTKGNNKSKSSKKMKKIQETSSSSLTSNRNNVISIDTDEEKPTETTKNMKKKKSIKKKGKITSTTTDNTDDEKSNNDKIIIANAFKEKDSAEALGDAIRNRADQIRFELSNNNNQQHQQYHGLIHPSIQSVGWAMGTSDNNNAYSNNNSTMYYKEMIFDPNNDRNDDDDINSAGGVEASPSAVIAHYFLKSHGGAHSLQCICSVLAMTAGLLSLLLQNNYNNSNNIHTMILLQKRSLTFAMIKHVTGLIAACMIAAKAIPNVGYRQARQWITQLIKDPVCQYVFYSACVLVWLPTTTITTTTTTTPTLTQQVSGSNNFLSFQVPLWYNYPIVNYCIVGPIVLREMISTILVLSDVLVLWNTATNGHGTISRTLLNISKNIVNAIMCLIVSPKKWKSSNSLQRQELLAKITSKCTLFMELIVGMIMTIDSIWSVISLLFGSSTSVVQQQSIFNIIKRIICTRLYIHFLYVRKRKIHDLVIDVRGGASIVPFHIMDIILNPIESMGMNEKRTATTTTTDNHNINERSYNNNHDNDPTKLKWNSYIPIAFGIDK